MSEVDDDHVDTILAQDMSRLSFQVRNEIQEEIHGVHSMAPKETELTVKDALLRMEESIQMIPTAEKQAYMNALAMSGEVFVLTDEMRLCFLRADLFDTSKAASRYTKYLNLLSKYFGPVALQRQLRYSDLTKKEQDLFRIGNAQILPSRDRSGRLIIVHHGSMAGEDVDEAMILRIVLFVYSVIAEDVDTQRHGAVGIFVGERQHFERYNRGSQVYQTDLSTFTKNLPVRLSAMHLCLPEGPLFTLLKTFLVIVLTKGDGRVRMKFYSGGLHNLEIQYKLMSFGIPIQELPVTHSGTLKNKNHAQWIKVRKLVDQERAREPNGVLSFVQYPGVHDVLFRRGGIHSQVGNILFQESMLRELSAYNAAHHHSEKREIRERIINAIEIKGGRFLEYNKDFGVWTEIIDPIVIHNKVVSAINDLHRMVSAKKHLQESRCDTEDFLGESKRQRLMKNDVCRMG
ncbi:hypothetical protein IV203_017232 [Nitzschia inconspicua]|uniref:DUF6824 domain-containing protein n=1 Tax=Nitzschia inconspicua TaxID=303405 RepID=A0A9K3KRR0_9STRA|nr:hypothetical protein IV203_017232 [Nitzschia inconspicua]